MIQMDVIHINDLLNIFAFIVTSIISLMSNESGKLYWQWYENIFLTQIVPLCMDFNDFVCYIPAFIEVTLHQLDQIQLEVSCNLFKDYLYLQLFDF